MEVKEVVKARQSPGKIVEKWDDDEPPAAREKSSSTEAAESKPVKKNSLMAKLISRKAKGKFESYVDREMLLREIIVPKIHSVMAEEVERVSSSLIGFSDRTRESRDSVKNRIEFVVNQTSQGRFRVVDYGSCATNLVTPFSDLDLAIDSGTNIMDKALAIEFLKLLADNLSLCSFVRDVKTIITASVPVIKLEADPAVEFEDLQMIAEGTRVKVDIIVKTNEFFESECTFTRTTSYVLSSKSAFPTFYQNMLVLKFALNCLNLMNAYKGGLNSYGLCLLYVTYLTHAKHEAETCHGLTLLNFMEFLCYEFDPTVHAINLNAYALSGIKLFTPKTLYNQTAPLVVFDPTNISFHNVTASCQNFQKIVDVFRNVVEQVEAIKAELVEHFKRVLEEADAFTVSAEVEQQIQQQLASRFFRSDGRLFDWLLGLRSLDECSAA